MEAKNSSTRVEFRRYYKMALKSCNKTKYWLSLLRDGFDCKDEELQKLLAEADEISKILATSVIKLKANKPSGEELIGTKLFGFDF